MNQKPNKLTDMVTMQMEDDGHLRPVVVVVGSPDLDENVLQRTNAV